MFLIYSDKPLLRDFWFYGVFVTSLIIITSGIILHYVNKCFEIDSKIIFLPSLIWLLYSLFRTYRRVIIENTRVNFLFFTMDPIITGLIFCISQISVTFIATLSIFMLLTIGFDFSF